ncbi:MAG: Gfo/Idh/MocA family oxidoreductase [Dehalococcoidia bacterium]
MTVPRVAIVGAGWAARNVHLPGFRSAGVPVAAICDMNAEPARKLAEQFNVPAVYTDWREMLEKEPPDAVSVCVPNVAHREIAVAALRAGAHVLCEKPLATTVSEAREMFACARECGRTLMAAQSWRFEAGSRAVSRVVESGGLGEVYYAEATALRRIGIPSWGVFHLSEQSFGGALCDVGVHMLDLAVWLMGNPEPVRVSAQTQRLFGTRPEWARMLRNAWDPAKFDVEDFAVALVRFANGATLLLRTTWAAHIDAETFSVRLLGTEAGATTVPPVIYRNRDGIPVDEQMRIQPVPMYDREIAHWVKVLAGEAEPLVRPEESMNVQRIVGAAYRSAAEGREVDVEPA